MEACWLAAGGSILAGQCALRDGWAANIGGGFHHACPDHGEGFCAIHDVAVAIRRLQHDSAIERAMVVDTDVHHGNGTAVIFRGDETVFTLSIHQENNYPFFKPPSTVDIDLPDGIGDDDYLGILEKHLHKAFQDFAPQILFYIAGADPLSRRSIGRAGAYHGRAGAERCAGFRICAAKRRSGGERAGGGLRAASGGHREHSCGTVVAVRDAARLSARAGA